MNEFSLATEILESVIDYSREHAGREVRLIRIELSQAMGINPAELCFCYDSIKQLTQLSQSVLEVELAAASPDGCDCVIDAIQFEDDVQPPATTKTIRPHERDIARPANNVWN